METYITISIWLLTTLVPNLVIAWKKGGWYWRRGGQYAGRKPAAFVWFVWILGANLFIYPMIQAIIPSLYAHAGEANALFLFVVTVGIWVYAFIWEEREIRP